MSEKKQKRLRQAKRHNKELDKIEVVFFNGRRRATEAEIKAEIKENYNKLEPSRLPKKYAKYLGSVKGGHKRQEEGVKIDGKYVNEAFFDNPDSPQSFKDIAKAQGKTKKQLFEGNKKLYEEAVKAYKSDKGFSMDYHSDEILKKIDTFGGKISINGVITSKLAAIIQVDNVDKAIKRKFESFYNDFLVSYKKGFSVLEITIPTVEQVSAAVEKEDLERDYDITINDSPDKKSKEDTLEEQLARWEKSLKPVNPERYEYEVKLQTKAGKFTTKKIKARSILDAENKAAQIPITKSGKPDARFKKPLIINTERIFKDGKKGKKA